VARRLAADGIAVHAGFHRRQEAAERLAESIRAAGGRAEPVPLDLAEPDRPDAVCQSIFDREGRLDILVNCAALVRESPAAGMDDATWRVSLETNLDGAFRLCRAAAKYMVLARRGRIVNLSSIVASRGGRGQANYAAAKAGLEALTRVLAIELGRKGITVNAVAPGVIETPLTERIRADHGPALLETIALERFGQPEEVAALVSFLASEAAGYITGQIVRIDGGMSL